MKKKVHSFMAGVRNRHFFGLDIITGCLVPSVALLLRVERLDQFNSHVTSLAIYTAAALIWKIGIFWSTGVYDRYWRHASMHELTIISMATGAAWTAGIIVCFGLLRPLGLVSQDFPRSVPAIDGLLTILVVSGGRFAIRLMFDLTVNNGNGESRKRGLIAGAGAAGSMIVKELRANPQLGLEPIGFVDDDPEKSGVRIHGVKVLGTLRDLPRLIEEMNVSEIIIAMPSAPGKVIRSVVRTCELAGVASKTIPGIFEVLNGSVNMAQVRDIQIEDLLRRGVVKTDTNRVAALIRGARVMVTGAGGSIGAELCRQISYLEPRELILVGHGENSIFEISSELHQHSLNRRGLHARTVIADVRHKERMSQLFQIYRPGVVFHAAAHKHVGLMEQNVSDAVTNNVLGTKILTDLAAQYGVQRFVMVSSDKAVNPASIMGVTKRIAELIVHEAALQTDRAFITVRFGNVLGSRGSVVPIFKRQIARGGPIRVSHPDSRRYFMTIPESVGLVLQAASMGTAGDLFVLDMGEPIKIVDLARDLIRLGGLEEGRDIDIVYSGLQGGEKLSEELFFESEKFEMSAHEKIFVCRNGVAKERSATFTDGERNQGKRNRELESPLQRDTELLVRAAQRGAVTSVYRLLRRLVPEYQGREEISGKGSLIPSEQTRNQGRNYVKVERGEMTIG